MFNTTKIVIATAALGIFLLFAETAHAGVIRKPPINLGLVGYWSFDVGKGGLTAVDQSGNGNTGTLTNMDAGSDWVDGQLGTALDFDGSDDYVDAGDTNAIDGVSQFTFSAWVKFDTLANYDGVVAKSADGASTDRMYMSLGGPSVGNNTSASVAVGNGSNSYSYTSTGLITTGNWQHWAGVFDGTQTGDANRLKFYFNGVQQTLTYVLSVPATTASTAYSLKIGLEQGTRNADGFIDEVRIYNRALSADEIRRLYNLRKPKILTPNNNGLVGYWSFNDGAGGYATDFSGNGNTGTLTNMDAASDWVDGKLGTALDFDGSNDYVSVVSGTAPASTVSISAWIYPTNAGVSNEAFGDTIYHWGVTTGCNPSSQMLYIKSNTLQFETGCGTVLAPSASSTQNNTWYHVAVTIDGSGNATLYNNGVAVAGPTNTRSGQSVSTGNDKIGAVHNAGNLQSFFGGLIDEVRIYNRALGAAEVTGLYQSGYAKINAPQNDQLTNGLVGYWTFNGKDLSFVTNLATDVSGNGNHGRLTNMSTSTAPAIGKVGQALNFDGSNDYVTSGGVFSDLGTSNKSYSLSVWAKPDAGETVGTILHVSSASDGTGWCLPMIGLNSNAIANSWKGTLSSVTSTTVLTNDWYHIVHTWDSANGLRIFINGVLETTTTQTIFTASGASNFVFAGPNLGACSGNPGSYFDGSIDEVRIYNRALSAQEVKRLYNMGK